MKLSKALMTITASVSLLYMWGCSSPLIYTSIWQKNPVIIDGKAKEWKIPLDYFDDKTKLNFSISNDKTNLYFCVRATEDETQRGIIKNGLQIWIDTMGGTKDQVGIQFPIMDKSSLAEPTQGSPRQSADGASEDTYSSNIARLKRHYSGLSKQMNLTGFTNATNGLAQVPNMYGINACLDWDTNGIMIYEVCIPLKTFYRSVADTSKVFGVSFVVSVTTTHKSMGGGGDMGGPGGMGGGIGGGMSGGGGGMHGGGGHGGHGGGENSTSTEKLTAHIKFRLAAGAGIQQY